MLHELQQMQQKKKKSSFKQEAHHRTFPSQAFLTQTPERDGSAPVALPSSTTGAWAMGSRGHELPELARTLGNPKPKISFSLGFFCTETCQAPSSIVLTKASLPSCGSSTPTAGAASPQLLSRLQALLHQLLCCYGFIASLLTIIVGILLPSAVN